MLELPDGSRQALAFTLTGSPLMLTAQRWRADCLNGTGLAVYSPDGVRYEMTRLFTEVGGPNPLYGWYATRISDRNGNFATINYGPGGFAEITGVSASDGRSVSFTYLDSGLLSRRIRTISANGQTWTYDYVSVGGTAPNVYRLAQVTRPDGTTWQYAYNGFVGNDNANNYQVQRMTYPQGGAVTYAYGFVTFDSVVNPNVRSVVVTTKSTSDGTWTFAYQPGNATNWDATTVTLPGSIGQIVYRHIGPNYAQSGNVWQIGLLMQKQLGGVQTENRAGPIRLNS